MAEFIQFDREIFRKVHLDKIRALGREIGVKAPTTKRRKKIIDEILLIQAGKLEPVPISKRGAPVKSKVDLTEFMEIEGSEYEDYYVEPYQNPTFNDSADCKVEGLFELNQNGYGFLRVYCGEISKGDAYVSQENVKKYDIRPGDKVVATIGEERIGYNSPCIQKVISINGVSPRELGIRKRFMSFDAEYPTDKIQLESTDYNSSIALRCVDLFAPLGRGQRGLIVAPPKTGKTTLLKQIAKSIEDNYKDITLYMLLINERPEEVTDMKRSIDSQVYFSTFDQKAEHHIRVAEMVVNRAKRLVEMGKDVVILMDSITRLARAYNSAVQSSGKILTGGLDPVAMQSTKNFFGAARNTSNGGSLTILSTALIETGSHMDDIIFEELKSTGNMEIRLSRELSEKRIFPAIDIVKSGTREEQRMLSEKELNAAYKVRKLLSDRKENIDEFYEIYKKTANNAEFIDRIDGLIKVYGK